MRNTTASRPRLERKYLVPGELADEVEMRVELHPAGFWSVYPRREVRTVYFDSQTLGHYRSAMDGDFFRIKPRVRWYKEEKMRRPVVAEVKEKRGELGRKRTKIVRVNRAKLADREYVKEKMAKEDLIEYLGLDPVLRVSYLRDYFQSADGRVRLTIDREMRFEDMASAGGGIDDSNVVVELKYDPENEVVAERVAQGLPFSLTKISKYVRGVGYFLVVVLMMVLVGAGQVKAQEEMVEGINGRELVVENDSYSFLLIGHAYGSPNIETGFPASTLLGNIKRINEMGVDFVVLLGDVVRNASESEFDNLDASLLSRLEMPVFNAPGNHELADRELYEETFGKTYTSFVVGKDKYLILDTGMEGEVGEEQAEFIQEEMSNIDEGIESLFVMSHRLFWLADRGELEELEGLTNRKVVSDEDRELREFFWELVEENKDLMFHFMAGDVGAFGEPSLLYKELRNVKFLATGLGDTAADTVIKVNVDQGEVGLEAISLTGSELMPLSEYSGEYWKEKLYVDQEREVGLAEKIKSLVGSKRFWLGSGLGVLVGFLMNMLAKKIE